MSMFWPTSALRQCGATRWPQALRRLVAAGAQLRPFSQTITEACLKASNEVNAETSASNPDFKKIYDSQMEFRNDGNIWWQVAEYSYETFMIRSRPKA
jgi:TRAP-type mannitol/chloroaromatic compound transport system substrate-binding protein